MHFHQPDEHEKLEREFAYYKQGKSPFISESAKLNAKVLDGYEWWELYGQTLPVLQGTAQRVLAQVSSAFAAERNWSIYGQVRNDKRCRLDAARADARVYCHEALQMHEKLLTPVTDKYYDLSDSDESDGDSVGADRVPEDEVAVEELMR
ncbi:hypothetical protein AB1Y20_013649 [Prymnesium parvum]|uniref:HAT C-terminal dimerisation domain-containing protein n=1 Tax=Prymnesium parvum TaxID=97485 RepID=A0AB34IJ67_PRYPA